jgi:hypothetical protein
MVGKNTAHRNTADLNHGAWRPDGDDDDDDEEEQGRQEDGFRQS